MFCDVMSWIFMLEMIFIRKQNNFQKKNCFKNKNYLYLLLSTVLFSLRLITKLWYSSNKGKNKVPFIKPPTKPRRLVKKLWVRRWAKKRFLIFPFHNSYFQSVNMAGLLLRWHVSIVSMIDFQFFLFRQRHDLES